MSHAAAAPIALLSDHLNALRGVAAIGVLFYHVRYRYFLDYADLPASGWLAKGFYGITSFGHDAVIVFFVISGFVISGSVIKDVRKQCWSWARYGLNRCTRLYVVLIPGLLLTLLCDQTGLWLFGNNAIYSGMPTPWAHDYFSVAERLNAPTLLANLMFLQDIYATPFGSNDPLWSLSYEFWYYLLFPCVWLAASASCRPRRRLAYLAFAGLVLCALGGRIAAYFPIWLLGAAVYSLPRIPGLRGRLAPLGTGVGFILCGAAIAVTHSGSIKSQFENPMVAVVALDYITGVAFAVFLYSLRHHDAYPVPGTYAQAGQWLAGFSFTLYVCHMPVLVLVRACLIPGTPWLPSFPNIAMACGIGISCVLFAYMLSRITEARTAYFRQAIASLLTGKVLTWRQGIGPCGPAEPPNQRTVESQAFAENR